MLAAASRRNPPRHAAFVRVTHWIAAISFLALLISGVEILISHPRFYWGETGNALTSPLFQIPIPASRATVPTGYGYVLPDQNGWSRYLHFQSAWAVVLTGLVYAIAGFWTSHFRSNLFPAPADRTWRAFRGAIAKHLSTLGFTIPYEEQDGAYQRYTGDASVPGKGEILVWKPFAS